MADVAFNKYRAAIEVLQRGRAVLVEALANEILDQGEELLEAGFLFNELLETQGTRLHFLCLLVNQLEQSAEAFDEVQPPPPPPKARARRCPRPKKLEQEASKKRSADDF